MNIYIGNLAKTVTEKDLREAFEKFGLVESATIIKDKSSGESKGFGFVDMPKKSDALAAIKALNGSELKGEKIKVNKARRSDGNRRMDDIKRTGGFGDNKFGGKRYGRNSGGGKHSGGQWHGGGGHRG